MRCSTKLIFGMLFLFLLGCAGLQPITNADRTFEIVVNAPGYSKEQIFNGTKIWIAENFNSAKAVLEYEDRVAGVLIGNGIIPYPCRGLECIGREDWKVPFTMRVDIKDQKFRLTFSNLHVSWPPSYSRTYGAIPGNNVPIGTRNTLDAVRPRLLNLGDQLLDSLGKEKGKTDW